MTSVTQLEIDLETRARLLAIQIKPLSPARRIREISIQCGRYAESLRMAGLERWRCVQAEDVLAELIRRRLHELATSTATGPNTIANFREHSA